MVTPRPDRPVTITDIAAVTGVAPSTVSRALNRPGRVRQMNECFKFPLGEWKQGEERRCRDSVIKILEIDFTYQCVPHALKFHWNNESIYVFAPDRGLYAVEHGSD